MKIKLTKMLRGKKKRKERRKKEKKVGGIPQNCKSTMQRQRFTATIKCVTGVQTCALPIYKKCD